MSNLEKWPGLARFKTRTRQSCSNRGSKIGSAVACFRHFWSRIFAGQDEHMTKLKHNVCSVKRETPFLVKYSMFRQK